MQMQLRLDEQQTEQYLIMQSIEEDCNIDINKKLDYPPVALSLGVNINKKEK